MNDNITKANGVSRRAFLMESAKGYAGITLAGTLLTSQSCRANSINQVHGACYHDCPDTCSWTVSAENGKIIEFKASQSNPYTAGRLCSKMVNFPNDVTFHPDRILTPLKRTGKKGDGQFIPISWEQASAEIAERLQNVISTFGGDAVLPFSFAGTQGLVQMDSISSRFFAHIGATKLQRTICGDTAAAGVMASNGTTSGVLPEDIALSRYIILWGTNPVISNQHLWPFILKAKANGAKIIVIDPFESQTAMLADRHLRPIPGTDTVLALGLIHIILSENLQDHDYIEKYTTGITELKSHTSKYDPGTVADITGIEQNQILQLAREYSSAKPSLIRVLIGMEHQANGASAFHAVSMLPALTGSWREHGGGLMHFTYELFGEALNWDQIGLADKIGDSNRRSVNMIQIGRVLNDLEMKPGIQALFVYNSNPAVIAPNQNLVIRGLQREDLLTVVLEHFITDTARYADFVLPATSQLEHWDLMTSWGQTYLNLNQPVIPPVGNVKPNSEIFRILSKAMGFTEFYLYESDLSIIKKSLKSDHAYMKGITFSNLKKNGWARLNLPVPWIPHAEGNFKTPSGKCEFYSQSLKDQGFSPLPEYLRVKYTAEELKKYPIHLLTIKSTKNFLNSSHANVGHLIEKEGKPLLDIHEEDAGKRGIKDGDEVKVFNQYGEVLITARIRKKVRKGVACMPQGFWSSLMKGYSSANALTNDLLTDLGEGAALQEARVEVVKI